MSLSAVSKSDLDALVKFDTATVCNALEVLRPEYRTRGYSKRPLLVARPDAPPVVGVARVGAIRAEAAPRPGSVPDRVSWYEYVATAAQGVPRQPSSLRYRRHRVDAPPALG